MLHSALPGCKGRARGGVRPSRCTGSPLRHSGWSHGTPVGGHNTIWQHQQAGGVSGRHSSCGTGSDGGDGLCMHVQLSSCACEGALTPPRQGQPVAIINYLYNVAHCWHACLSVLHDCKQVRLKAGVAAKTPPGALPPPHLVHVVVAGTRLVAHPDAEVLHTGGLLLKDLCAGTAGGGGRMTTSVCKP
jgi:hypothetical protein